MGIIDDDAVSRQERTPAPLLTPVSAGADAGGGALRSPVPFSSRGAPVVHRAVFIDGERWLVSGERGRYQPKKRSF